MDVFSRPDLKMLFDRLIKIQSISRTAVVMCKIIRNKSLSSLQFSRYFYIFEIPKSLLFVYLLEKISTTNSLVVKIIFF